MRSDGRRQGPLPLRPLPCAPARKEPATRSESGRGSGQGGGEGRRGQPGGRLIRPRQCPTASAFPSNMCPWAPGAGRCPCLTEKPAGASVFPHDRERTPRSMRQIRWSEVVWPGRRVAGPLRHLTKLSRTCLPLPGVGGVAGLGRGSRLGSESPGPCRPLRSVETYPWAHRARGPQSRGPA